jgi:hypothetical protein
MSADSDNNSRMDLQLYCLHIILLTKYLSRFIQFVHLYCQRGQFFLRVNVSVSTTQTNLHHPKRRNYMDLSGNVKSRPPLSPGKEAIE